MAVLIIQLFNPIALRKAKIVCNFGLSDSNRVKMNEYTFRGNNFAVSILSPFSMDVNFN